MGAVVLSLAFSVMVGIGIWLLIGPRLRLNPDPAQNSVLNVFAYVAMVFPLLFVLVFVGLG